MFPRSEVTVVLVRGENDVVIIHEHWRSQRNHKESHINEETAQLFTTQANQAILLCSFSLILECMRALI